jgi:hypothetical protein
MTSHKRRNQPHASESSRKAVCAPVLWCPPSDRRPVQQISWLFWHLVRRCRMAFVGPGNPRGRHCPIRRLRGPEPRRRPRMTAPTGIRMPKPRHDGRRPTMTWRGPYAMPRDSLRQRPRMTAPTGIRMPKPRHGGRRPTIHGLRCINLAMHQPRDASTSRCINLASRGWRASAHHDAERQAPSPPDSVILGRRLSLGHGPRMSGDAPKPSLHRVRRQARWSGYYCVSPSRAGRNRVTAR